MKYLKAATPPDATGAGRPRIRAAGGGRKKTTHKDATLLRDLEVELIAATTGAAGLSVHAGLDRNPYPAGIKVKKPERQRGTGRG